MIDFVRQFTLVRTVDQFTLCETVIDFMKIIFN